MHAFLLNVTLGLIVILAGVSTAEMGWIVQTTSGETLATYNGVSIFSHSLDKPAIFLGTGSTTYKEYHGNFDISDYINSKVPLEELTVSSNNLTFSSKTNGSPQITMELTASDDGFGEMVFSTPLPTGFTRVWLRFSATPSDKIYGGGEQYTYLNLRGKSFPIWTREQGVGRNKSSQITFLADTQSGGAGGDYHTTYYGEPTFFSTAGYMIHSLASWYTIMDFGHDDFHELEIHGAISSIKVAAGATETVSTLAQKYSLTSGLMPELPEWLYTGAVLGVQGGTQKMLDYLNKTQDNGIAVSALWIQDWAGRIKTSFGRRVFWNWEWNEEHYPGLNTTIPMLEQKGVRVLTYINPYLNVEGDLFKEADAQGFFVKNGSGDTRVQDFGEFYCGSIDLTHPGAVAWYKERIIRRAIDLGIAGWMADFSEYLAVEDSVFYSGESALELHNKWPTLWAKLNREAIEEAGKLGKVVFWMRAGYSGVSNYTTLMWNGDQNVDYTKSDGLASTIPASLSMGMQGIGMTHFDIGMYTSLFGETRDKELLLRSAEFAIFTAIMRTHEGNRPAENWQVYSDVDTMKKFARLVQMFKNLAPYTKQYIREYTQTGIPLMRTMFSYDPEDPKCYEAEYQYMFGADALIAPVIEANATKWKAYLPKGDWIHLWSDIEYNGKSEVEVDAPLGQPPVFYLKSSSFDWKSLKLDIIPDPQPSSIGSKLGLTCATFLALMIPFFC